MDRSDWKKQFEVQNAELEGLFQELDVFDESRLNLNPGPEKWSALKTLEHVLLVEVYTFGYLKKKLSYNPKLKKANFLSAFRRMFLKFYLRNPIPFPAPKAVGTDNLPDHSEFEDLKSRFRNHRKDFEAFVQATPLETINAQVYKHFIVGRLDGLGTMVFMQEHFRRHRKQALKAVADR